MQPSPWHKSGYHVHRTDKEAEGLPPLDSSYLSIHPHNRDLTTTSILSPTKHPCFPNGYFPTGFSPVFCIELSSFWRALRDLPISRFLEVQSRVTSPSSHRFLFITSTYSFSAFLSGHVNCQGYVTSVTNERAGRGGGKMLTEKKRITRRKPRVNASSSTTNLTWSSLGSKPGLLGEISATKRLGCGSAPMLLCEMKEHVSWSYRPNKIQ